MTELLSYFDTDMLTKEPPWCDSEHCVECGTKFGIKTRKHHWYAVTSTVLYRQLQSRYRISINVLVLEADFNSSSGDALVSSARAMIILIADQAHNLV